MFLKLLKLFKFFYKQFYIKLWRKVYSKKGNVHLSSNTKQIIKIPFTKNKVWIRPSVSDTGRVREYLSKIYFTKSYLHLKLKQIKPTLLIDIGANIGLSSLSFLEEFPSIKRIIAIEGEKENYEVLKSNFSLWESKFKNIKFDAMHAIATNDQNIKMVSKESLSSLTGKNTASGTFRFGISNKKSNIPSLSISNLFKQFKKTERVIVKIDIEGGEEYLLKSNNNWVNSCYFLTLEIHDRFHPELLHSSTNILKVLNHGNFAITPSKDVLHCYNRDYLF